MRKFIQFFAITICMVLLTSSVPIRKSELTPNEKVLNKSLVAPAKMTLEQFVKMSYKDFAILKGKKMTIKEKLVLKFTQRQLKKEIIAGHVSKDYELDALNHMNEELPKFNIGGFVLGFLLGLIGVGLAYIFSNDKSFRRSSWYGFGGYLILLIVLYAIAMSSY